VVVAADAVDRCAGIRFLLDEQMPAVDVRDGGEQRGEVEDAGAELLFCFGFARGADCFSSRLEMVNGRRARHDDGCIQPDLARRRECDYAGATAQPSPFSSATG
jgi:hypothetical protein